MISVESGRRPLQTAKTDVTNFYALKGQESEGILKSFCVVEGCSDAGIVFLPEEFARQGQIGGESFRVNTIKW